MTRYAQPTDARRIRRQPGPVLVAVGLNAVTTAVGRRRNAVVMSKTLSTDPGNWRFRAGIKVCSAVILGENEAYAETGKSIEFRFKDPNGYLLFRSSEFALPLAAARSDMPGGVHHAQIKQAFDVRFFLPLVCSKDAHDRTSLASGSGPEQRTRIEDRRSLCCRIGRMEHGSGVELSYAGIGGVIPV